jgi:predicted Zn-dependent protease
MSSTDDLNLTRREAKELLQKWREENSRNPQKVRRLWSLLDLDKYLGDEKWPALEQVCLAAMDLHDAGLIKDCLNQLDTKFPGSGRVKRLKAMAKLELRDRFDDALKLYDDMIRKDETNSALYKRKIAILIAQKKIAEAIQGLTDYLKKFMNDQEAWLELGDLYIQEQDYPKAAFCLEELILTNPHNHLYHEKYAEIQYTMGSAESLELARAYFAQALKLNPSNVRALFGLQLTATSLSALPKCTSQKRKEHAKIAAWASTQIAQMYHEQGAQNQHQVAAVEGMMASLQITTTN